ncbi:MAG: alpha/beta fold hydrolase [Verrucomicrobiales bacterium]|nr:alpha/beta fold hydrolase [Verrucomicrobiales bacterium]
MRQRHRAWLSVLVLAGVLLGTGCAPSRWVAQAMLRAPNRAPDFLRPQARVTLRWPEGLVERFPSGTLNLGSPSVPIHWVLVEPANYGMRLKTIRRQDHRRFVDDFEMKVSLPADGLPAPDRALGTAFLVHGYGVDLESLFPCALYLAEAGWRCVLVDLRGHGLSGGRRVYLGTVETNDLRELRQILEDQGRVNGPYVAVGHSLGAAISLRWQTVDPAIRATVGFGSVAELRPGIERVRKEYASWMPAGLVRRAAAHIPGILGVSPESLDTTSAIEGRLVRAYLVASDVDRVTPPEDSAQLWRQVGPGSGFLIIGGISHESLPYALSQHGAPVRRWLAELAAEMAIAVPR